MTLEETIKALYESSAKLKMITEVTPEERMDMMDIFTEAQLVLEGLIEKLNELPDSEENGMNLGNIKGDTDVAEVLGGLS